MAALCSVLRNHGYHVEGAVSGREALARLSAGAHEVLMTDLCIPDMDGISLIREAQQGDPDLMGIIMTGQGSIESAVEALKGGAQDYA